MQFDTGKLPDTTPYWSPRVGFNWDATNDQKTQVRGGTGLFSGKPPYVWISNQIGNNGVLFGFVDTLTATTAYGFNPNPDEYKPAPTGGSAASYELDVTDASFRFPQTLRNNIGVDRRCRGASPAPSTTCSTTTSTLRSTSMPTCPPPRRPSAASTRGRTGPRRPTRCRCHGLCDDARAGERPLRYASEQRSRERSHRQLRDQEPGRQLLVEHLRLAREEHDPRLRIQGRIQLRRLEEHR